MGKLKRCRTWSSHGHDALDRNTPCFCLSDCSSTLFSNLDHQFTNFSSPSGWICCKMHHPRWRRSLRQAYEIRFISVTRTLVLTISLLQCFLSLDFRAVQSSKGIWLVLFELSVKHGGFVCKAVKNRLDLLKNERNDLSLVTFLGFCYTLMVYVGLFKRARLEGWSAWSRSLMRASKNKHVFSFRELPAFDTRPRAF